MKDDDRPITRGELRRGSAKGCGVVAGIIVIGSILMYGLYIMACANMPTGCH